MECMLYLKCRFKVNSGAWGEEKLKRASKRKFINRQKVKHKKKKEGEQNNNGV